MKRIFVLSILILGALQTHAQYDKNMAIGLRVGEPLGLNLRKYFRYGDRSFDVNFGTYGFIYGRYRKYRKGHYDASGIMFQGLYNFNTSLGKNDGVHAYAGFGGQVNYRGYSADENQLGERLRPEKQISLGPAGNVGLEYNIPGNDLGVFLDAGLYAELVPDLLFLHPQVSAGIRVNLTKN
ncbi:hypothetical protein LAG90_00850 [Marinilongibacter aquaticus]|uniref:hypothetical protein n=1 Tax=Marinilongibacter aquaticus TaxID=2975157 RepID=UPI0021BDC554|nr:hypothetical protein [Marinilongibacter aquaticus]UBM59206.1 hypothetical protein LAG90_00850 [Marinilongibacter aquaticus]